MNRTLQSLTKTQDKGPLAGPLFMVRQTPYSLADCM